MGDEVVCKRRANKASLAYLEGKGWVHINAAERRFVHRMSRHVDMGRQLTDNQCGLLSTLAACAAADEEDWYG